MKKEVLDRINVEQTTVLTQAIIDVLKSLNVIDAGCWILDPRYGICDLRFEIGFRSVRTL